MTSWELLRLWIVGDLHRMVGSHTVRARPLILLPSTRFGSRWRTCSAQSKVWATQYILHRETSTRANVHLKSSVILCWDGFGDWIWCWRWPSSPILATEISLIKRIKSHDYSQVMLLWYVMMEQEYGRFSQYLHVYSVSAMIRRVLRDLWSLLHKRITFFTESKDVQNTGNATLSPLHSSNLFAFSMPAHVSRNIW